MLEGNTPRQFDLNIGTVLDHWDVHHAVRELIANALDEQALTGTPDISIAGSDGHYEIRDYGRGIRYAHLTQDESEEKTAGAGGVIGKFGVGLKDALATLDRHRVKVTIKSRHGDITTARLPKHGFDDVSTLHACVAPPSDPSLEGTLIALDGCSAADMDEARSRFLRFSGDTVLETTKYGDIVERVDGRPARVYINGVVAAEEPNFMFSYNITSLTRTMRKELNRERTNVGRAAYKDRVIYILRASTDKGVAGRLVSALDGYASGTQSDEMTWDPVTTHVCKMRNAAGDTVFATPGDLERNADYVDRARRDGMAVTVVSGSVRGKISGVRDAAGGRMRDLGAYKEEHDKSFEFKFVEPGDLTDREREVYGMAPAILAMSGLGVEKLPVRVSETMRALATDSTSGVWDKDNGWVVVKRDVLSSAEAYAGTILHGAVRATSGAPGMTRKFEAALVQLLGRTAIAAAGDGAGAIAAGDGGGVGADKPRSRFWRRGS